MSVKAVLIVSVASLDLAIVPWCSRTNKLVFNLIMGAEYVKGMYALGLGEMSKLHSVICLDRLGGIAKEDDCTFHEIYGGIAAVFLIGIDKALP